MLLKLPRWSKKISELLLAKSVPTAIKHKNKNIFYKNCKKALKQFYIFCKKNIILSCLFFSFSKNFRRKEFDSA